MTTSTNSNRTGSDNMGPPVSSPAILTSKIEMTISCVDLLNLHMMSKSDPFCIVKMKKAWQNDFLEIGRTEQITDNLNPEWVKKFILSYNFETIQNIRFEIWDKDPSEDDFLGEYETTLAEIASYSGRQYRGKLKRNQSHNADNAGYIVIVAEEVSSCNDTIKMTFQAIQCEKQRWFKRNDPFLVFSRLNEDATFSVVFKTEVVYSSKNPIWKQISISARRLCNGDQHRPIKIDCFDSRTDGDHKLIGTCQTSLRILKKGVGENNQYRLRKDDQSKDSTGTLELKKVTVTEGFSFLEFIRGGTQMHFAVAIDFTASNGSPMQPESLHYLSDVPNRYEIALMSVGEIMQHYDPSHMYPAFGFGVKLPNGDVSHNFPLNGNQSYPFCANIQEILTHYRNTLASIQPFGRTNFSPVIQNTVEISKQYQNGKHYFVLLIITEGVISDMHPTIRSIISASKLPISIIIVGVGNVDFGAMDVLDSDDKRLSLDGEYAERDIVQFVPLNRFLKQNGTFVKSQADLAKAILAEIPDQMTIYMKSKGFKPQVIPNTSVLPKPSAPISFTI